jgi:hypothetical protein
MPISMRDVSRTLVICVAGALFLSSPSLALRKVSAEAGYVATSVSKYASGLVYGVGIMEGTGRFGFGLSLLRFANSTSYEKPIKSGAGEIIYRYQEDFSDFYVSILGTYMRDNSKKGTLMIAGLGPQVHFLAATKQYILEKVSITAHEARLGMGAVLRYERVMGMFGNTTIFVGAAWSWMQSGIEVVGEGEYAPPAEGMTSGTITAGLAFPL